MTENDKKLFNFLFDYEGIIYVSEFSNNKETLSDEPMAIFTNKKYSNVNVQDKSGNTFLHYAMQNISFPNIIITELINAGADPFIKNNQDKNCFQHRRISQTKISDFWKSLFQKNHFNNNFTINTLGLHQNLIQSIFNQSLVYIDSHIDIISEMKKSNLISPENITKLPKKLVFCLNEHILNTFLNLEHTETDRTKFLYEAIAMVSLDKFSIKDKDATLSFLKEYSFNINADFINIFRDSSFVRINYNTTMNEDTFRIDVVKALFSHIIKADVEGILIKEIKDSFNSILDTYPALSSIYFAEYLNMTTVKNKDSKKIKI